MKTINILIDSKSLIVIQINTQLTIIHSYMHIPQYLYILIGSLCIIVF